MSAIVVVGGQFGDEGKGKIVSAIATRENVKYSVRGGVGPNAGHTVVVDGKTYKIRQLPSAFHVPGSEVLIGPGVLIDPDVLIREIEITQTEGRLFIDSHCAIIDESHRQMDRSDSHLKDKIGSTGSGCGPANAERAMRKIRLAKDEPRLASYIKNVPQELHAAIKRGETLLVEGTQATFLSLYHGTYPFVTSKDTCASGILSDVGLGPKHVRDVVIVFKAFVTRVGEGPLLNEYTPEETIARGFVERGTVTGRLRRAAPFDFDLARRAVDLNSATQIAVTKVDALFPADKGKTSFAELSDEAKAFLREIEAATGVPVKYIGTGPESESTIFVE